MKAATAAQDYAQQSLDAEQKKLHLGASTTANVLQQERNLATAEDNLIVYQRGYEANSKVVTTSDQLSQDTINLIR